MQQTHTRLWWVEVLRGIVAIPFGLLFFLIEVRFFIYAIGIYLIIDGSLDTYKIAKGKRTTKRRALSTLGSRLSILLGMIFFIVLMLPLPDQPLKFWRTNQRISTILHLQRDEQLSSSDDWGQMDLAILDGLLNGITAGSIQVQSKTKRANLMPNRKRWDFGRPIRS